MCLVFIFLELEPFPYYFVFTTVLSLSNEKWILAQLDQCPPRKKVNGYMVKLCPSFTTWEKQMWQFLIYPEIMPFF